MKLTKVNYANSSKINSMVHVVLLGILIALFSGYSESAEMKEVHALIEAAKVQVHRVHSTIQDTIEENLNLCFAVISLFDYQ